MSSGWSSELIVVDHHDINASTMAVDSTGSTALLAGRQWLYLKNLNCPADLLAQYSRKSKFNVKAAEWNPHSQHRDQCAIASGCSVEIRVVTEGSFAPLVTAGNHLRLVSSICWHPSDGQIIVSSSLDKLCRIWDLREPSRPVIAFRSVDVCNEVKCNRADGYLLATSHGGDVRLWDHRKANQPTHYFTISESTIHCLDWSCSNENQLAVGSQDCAVRIVDASSTRHHFTMSMISPVWRASYTPFGMGLLVAGVAGRRRGGDSLQLWSIAAPTAPAHTFLGHSDVVLSYGWRHFRSENSNYQLVTWSRDQTLRLWEIDRYLENMCNSLNEETSIKTDDCEGSQLNFEIECESRGSSVDREANDEDGHASVAMEAEEDGWSDNPDPPIILPSPQDPMTTSMDTEGNSDGSSAPSRRASAATGCRVLTLELAALGDLPDGTIVSVEQSNGEDMNGGEFVHIRLLVAGRNIGIFVVFPSEYPHHAAPTFEFVAAETDLDQATQDRLLLHLKHITQQRVRKNRTCFEYCIRQLLSTLEPLILLEEKGGVLKHEESIMSKYFHDSFIPFPKYSGANFCNAGTLIVFIHRSRVVTGDKTGDGTKRTPRNLSSLARLLPDSLHEKVRRTSRQRLTKNFVTIFNISCLFPINKSLAEKYMVDSSNAVGMCELNGQIARETGRDDLEETWRLAALAAALPYTAAQHHPLGLGMVHAMIEHYTALHDIQTAAMLCCAFGSKTIKPLPPKPSYNKSLSPDLQAGSGGWSGVVEGWRSQGLPRSSSWSDVSLAESVREIYPDAILTGPPIATNKPQPQIISKVELDHCELYDLYKAAYAEILECWQLLHARAKVLKYVGGVGSGRGSGQTSLEMAVRCTGCKAFLTSTCCPACLTPALSCAICCTPVRGLASSCLECHHGGHMKHMESWFSRHAHCPAGCGCFCVRPCDPALS